MKTEHSAGGIIVRNIRGIWEVLVIRDSQNVLTFPKGLIQKDEDPADTALREIGEEVGLTQISVIKKLPVIRYIYKKKEFISKTVQYYFCEATGDEKLKPQHDEGIHNAEWLPIDTAIENIGYPKTNKKLLVLTKQFIWKSHPRLM